jgi:NifU-like protein
MMAELCIGKTVDEAVKITNIDVEFALRDTPDEPAVPPQKMHCSVMAYDVIKKAASIYKGVDMESFEDEIIVCECARVSLQTIKDVIKINNLKTVEEITAYTKAGAFCKSCIKPGGHEDREYYLVDILAQTRAEMEGAAQAHAVDTEDFKSMTVVKKTKLIEKTLDEHIRPMLIMDGGNLELLDIKEEGDETQVFIRYIGACNGCASSSTGTLYAIEAVLRRELDVKIRVLPI